MNLTARAARALARLSFRDRLMAASAMAVAVAVVASSVVIFFVIRGQLNDQFNSTLVDLAAQLRPTQDPVTGAIAIDVSSRRLEGIKGYAQFVDSQGFTPSPPAAVHGVVGSGEVSVVRRRPLIPSGERARGVAAGVEPAFFQDVRIRGSRARVLTKQILPNLAVQVARPLDDLDETLRRLAWVLMLLAVGGIGVAAALGHVVARAALAPVRRLTDATEHVSTTADLTRRIEVEGADELSRFASSFNSMLAALEASLRSQKQLVADASHELRTPVTSIRTNIEVLQRGDGLEPDERARIFSDVVAQLGELSVLIGDLIDVARGNELDEAGEIFRLDELVNDAVERAAKHADDLEFEIKLEPCLVTGVRSRVSRAVSNLLDNAVKWSPRPGAIEVTVARGEVTVRDHGPGIDDSDLPHIFERFYRAPAARGMSGSGLGLAIVKDVAEAHGGRVTAHTPVDGGALLRLRLTTAS